MACNKEADGHSSSGVTPQLGEIGSFAQGSAALKEFAWKE